MKINRWGSEWWCNKIENNVLFYKASHSISVMRFCVRKWLHYFMGSLDFHSSHRNVNCISFKARRSTNVKNALLLPHCNITLHYALLNEGEGSVWLASSLG